MRSRMILVLAVMTILLLAVGWLWPAQYYAHRPTRAGLAADTNAAPLVKTNFLVRRQFFAWQEVESDDYPTYIANLRNIGCPEQTIRDIIIADVNALYARKQATEVRT